jgi:thiamine-phosphate pyrophosphorylase
MKIIVISPAINFKNEHEIVVKLFENGLTTYHVRKPLYSLATLKKYIEKMPEQFHNRLVIHSHHTIARKFNLLGVHYSDKDFQPNFKNWWREKRLASKEKVLIKTTSYQKLSALYEKKEMSFDYVFLMPVFDPITGNYQSGYYEDGLKNAIQKSKEKIIVLGGVGINKIEKITELGFYGMGLSSCLWEKENPIEEYGKIIARCRELGVGVD